MEKNDIECIVCGGTDFYKEAGYFYCNECQTQSQEVREHVFENEEIAEGAPKTSHPKIKKLKTEKLDKKITSWECYNIVIHSLTEQLINLGADKTLKPVVKCIWMKYLQKLEVFDLEWDIKPRLQLINSKKDSHILYNVLPKKRKWRKSSDESSVSAATISTKERSKRKRALVQADYKEFSQKSTQESTSLHNETLSSLKSASEKSDKSEEPVNFNRYSVRELKKRTSRSHLKKHKLDRKRDLTCHKLTYKSCSNEYQRGIHFLSPIKIYCVLYLGLLINRDEMQLGDLFRFIREGHLTFNNYSEVFPEEFHDKFVNILNNSKNNMFCSRFFRVTTAKIAVFLNLTPYINVVDLTELCKRFCKEMNLPDEVYASVRNLISKVTPKLVFTSKSKIVPNYEGRAMSLIVFVLKLLFGLDGVTEWEMSKYAKLVNNSKVAKPKMFDIVEWMQHIGHRNLLMRERHFPSMYLADSNEVDSDLFLQYYESQGTKINENVYLTKEMKGFKELLTKILELQNDNPDKVKFEPSYTPYSDYFQSLGQSKCKLNQSFKNDSLDFLLRPNKYLDLVSDDWRVKHGGANDRWVLEEIKTYAKLKLLSCDSLQMVPVEISTNGEEKDIEETLRLKTKVKESTDPQRVQKNYDEGRKRVFRKNEKIVKRVSKAVELVNDTEKVKSGYNVHYNPYERYWLYLHMNAELFSKKDIDLYFNKHPNTFKLIFNECARIIEQTTQDLVEEFQYSELFLVYSASYSEKDEKKNQKFINRYFKLHIDQAVKHW